MRYKTSCLTIYSFVWLVGSAVCFICPGAVVAESHDHGMHDHASHEQPMHKHAVQDLASQEQHASHDQGPDFTRSEQEVIVPGVILINQNNQRVNLKSLLDSDDYLVVNFIYASCTTACPMLSAGFADLQERLGSKIRLVSITIDPENDTPKIMQEHLDHYQAQPGWDFLTGSRADINRTMKAFDAYSPNKMSHTQLNFIKSTEDGKWIRVAGMPSGSDLANEIETVYNW